MVVRPRPAAGRRSRKRSTRSRRPGPGQELYPLPQTAVAKREDHRRPRQRPSADRPAQAPSGGAHGPWRQTTHARWPARERGRQIRQTRERQSRRFGRARRRPARSLRLPRRFGAGAAREEEASGQPDLEAAQFDCRTSLEGEGEGGEGEGGSLFTMKAPPRCPIPF